MYIQVKNYLGVLLAEICVEDNASREHCMLIAHRYGFQMNETAMYARVQRKGWGFTRMECYEAAQLGEEWEANHKSTQPQSQQDKPSVNARFAVMATIFNMIAAGKLKCSVTVSSEYRGMGKSERRIVTIPAGSATGRVYETLLANRDAIVVMDDVNLGE